VTRPRSDGAGRGRHVFHAVGTIFTARPLLIARAWQRAAIIDADIFLAPECPPVSICTTLNLIRWQTHSAINALCT
jgi:hypothetical protein